MFDELNKHKQLKFPGIPNNEEFADWLTELIEVDAYYVGLAQSYINGLTKQKINYEHFHQLENDLTRFEILKQDVEICHECKQYLLSLKRVMDSIESSE